MSETMYFILGSHFFKAFKIKERAIFIMGPRLGKGENCSMVKNPHNSIYMIGRRQLKKSGDIHKVRKFY
jgi:hypothetical protein